MHTLYKILRAVLVTLIALPSVFAIGFYILLSLPWAQNALRNTAERDLTALLGSDVHIENVSIFPFDEIKLSGISVNDDFGAEALNISSVTAGIDLYRLLSNHRIVIDYIAIKGMQANLSKASDDAPLNIAGIIDKLKPKDKNNQPKSFDLKVNTLVLDDITLTYSVLDAPSPLPDKFDPRHIIISDLNVSMNIPIISNNDIELLLYSLSFKERSGFEISNLKTSLKLTPDSIDISGLSLSMPNSMIEMGRIALPKSAVADTGNIRSLLSGHSIPVEIKDGSYITPADIQAIIPATSIACYPIFITLDAALRNDNVVINMRIYEPTNDLLVDLSGTAGNILNTDSLNLSFPTIYLSSDVNKAAPYISDIPSLVSAMPYLRSLGSIEFNGSIDGNIAESAKFSGNLRTNAGNINLHAAFGKHGYGQKISADFSTAGFNLRNLLPKYKLGLFAGKGSADISLLNKDIKGKAAFSINALEYNGYTYTGITSEISRTDDWIDADINIADPNINLNVNSRVNTDPDLTELNLSAMLNNFRPDILGLTNRFAGYALSARMKADFIGNSIESADGELSVLDINFIDGQHNRFNIDTLIIGATSSEIPNHIDIRSDILNGRIEGRYNFSALPSMTMAIMEKYLPSLIDPSYITDTDVTTGNDIVNDFEFELNISPCPELCNFFKLPVSIVSQTSIYGRFDDFTENVHLDIKTDFLQHGSKMMFYDSALAIEVDNNQAANLYATTSFNTKKGPMTIVLDSQCLNDTLKTQIEWEILRSVPIKGIIDFDTAFDRIPHDVSDITEQPSLSADIRFNPRHITFGETLWAIEPSDIRIMNNDITVNNFTLNAGNEKIHIDGRISDNPEDKLTVDLQNMELYEIFETLQINKALIGGKATGRVCGSSLLTKQPIIISEKLKVDSISYNKCVLGDASIKADFDIDRKAFTVKADISQYNGRKSAINGEIFAGKDSLNINFNINRTNVGFLKPFMSAFANSVEGKASGHARLFGTFKEINLEGDLLVDSLNLGIDITNTVYTVLNDSLHITPGKIQMDNITVYDPYGNTAMLNGYLAHDFFRKPNFEFNITDADRMLVYNTTSKNNPRWYGKLFANGSAAITGRPSEVNIDVHMSTSSDPRSKSTFTIALLDMMDAGEYSFISFNDRTENQIDSLTYVDETTFSINKSREKTNTNNTQTSSRYSLNFDIGVNDNTEITLVMDPAAGDKITAFGDGQLTLEYNSGNEELIVKGLYELDRGNYTYSLQDIIVQNFNIRNKSSISFSGSPYAPDLNIEAAYSLRANLADLDPSFLQDKDINRRDVQVDAIIKLNGKPNQPDIDYDFEFPDSPADVYRRVQAIIGTGPEMKSQQMMYLLAFKRFYTPEYMSANRSNNELLSLAASTVSSQIGNMLGALSDNWTVAPTLRSERGDFSDVEVDVALTSRLLNNRLIFNGNFGYRDPSMNTNRFVGDFDIEYLLNHRGTWRLKAYNRYNDQNYYLRSATTTQGIGIMYKRDFNNMFGFLRRKKQDKTADQTPSAPADSIQQSSPLTESN